MRRHIEWEKIWKEFKGPIIFKKLRREQQRVLVHVLNRIKLNKNSWIIDVGCGSGFILYLFKSLGYINSIGIDNSKESIKTCERVFNLKEAKDVFLMDAAKTKFPKNHFDLVFSHGMLEHFDDLAPFVKEMCRISKKWILIFQPDPNSLINRFKQMLASLIIKFYKRGRLYLESLVWKSEFKYEKDDYVSVFSKHDFNLIESGGMNFSELFWLLFKKRSL